MISRVYKMEDLGWDSRVADCYAAEAGRVYNKNHMELLWNTLLSNGAGALWKYEQEEGLSGVCGGVVSPHPLSGELYASLLLWYVLPQARSSVAATDMLNEFEMWARGRGALTMQASVPINNKRLAALHERRGMKVLETIYQKELF